jgi:micrococcal nuclease
MDRRRFMLTSLAGALAAPLAAGAVLTAAWVTAMVLLAASAIAQSWQGAIYDARIWRVIDGDTIEVLVEDRVETVRYIGINTPEIHHPTRGREPFGEAARWAKEALVVGRAVQLLLDVQPRDRDGRLLAYVYVNGQLVNAELVRRGYAEVSTYPPNVQHYAEFVELQRQARSTKQGLWGDAAALAAYKAQPSGVVGSKNTRVYLHPDDPSWRERDPDNLVYFESADQARAQGYVPSLDYPRYASQEGRALAGGPDKFVSSSSSVAPPAAQGAATPPAETP